jgi:hypothetical protein
MPAPPMPRQAMPAPMAFAASTSIVELLVEPDFRLLCFGGNPPAISAPDGARR